MNQLKILLTSLFFISSIHIQAQIYVHYGANGTNDGSTWQNAFTDLKTAINAATAGDQIWVAAGTYLPGDAQSNPDSTWFTLKNGVEMFGGFTGTETSLAERDFETNLTILSGDLIGNDLPGEFFENREDNCSHVLLADGTVGTNTLLDGFVIEGGHTDIIPPQGDTLDFAPYVGGGLFSLGAPTVRNCTFKYNKAEDGGGIGVFGQAANGITIENCVFEENEANHWGGGIWTGPTPEINIWNCEFTKNNAVIEAGAAAFISDSKANISNCQFNANTAIWGGALCFFSGSHYQLGGEQPLDISIDSCSFENNEAANIGGAIFNWSWSESHDVEIKVSNSSFSGNEAYWSGAVGGHNSGTNFNFTAEHCTFEDNYAYSTGGAFGTDGYVDDFETTINIVDCDFTGNTTSFGNNEESSGGAVKLEGYVLGSIQQSRFISNHSDFSGAVDIVTLPEYLSLNNASYVEINDCLFEENVAELSGGGVFFSWQASGKVERCTFLNNQAFNGGGLAFSGTSDVGIDPTLQVNACVFEGNAADGGGGGFGLGFNTIPVTISNSLFYDNTDMGSGLGLFGSNSEPCEVFAFNNTFANNEVAIELLDYSTIHLQNNIFDNPVNLAFTGQFTVNSLGGNLVSSNELDVFLIEFGDQNDVDPMLDDEFQLTENSPAVDAGIVPDDATEFDLAGNPRLQGGCIDIGAYESPFDAGVGCLTAAREVLVNNEVLSISPNPVSLNMMIELNNEWRGTMSVRIIDLTGQTVHSAKEYKYDEEIKIPLEVSHLPSGIYRAVISNGEKMVSKSWVKI